MITEHDINTALYFIQLDDLTYWAEWEGRKEEFLEKFPTLKKYLKKKQQFERAEKDAIEELAGWL